MIDPVEIMKKKAGEKAAEYVENGMTLGLGSGSTVYWTIKKIGDLVQQGMDVKGIPSSLRTQRWAKEFGIPLTGFSDVESLDITIDGADEVTAQLDLLKGGGGSLVREKMVAEASSKVIIVVDKAKKVETLGQRPIPVEVIPFGWERTAKKISNIYGVPQLRKTSESENFISDNGNYILDCAFNSIPQPEYLHEQLKSMCGVVETGLFINMADIILIGEETHVSLIR